jgi:ribosome-interacting GTPase 1
MTDIQKKIDELEAEMARTQKNKATNYHLVRPGKALITLQK